LSERSDDFGVRARIDSRDDKSEGVRDLGLRGSPIQQVRQCTLDKHHDLVVVVQAECGHPFVR
jgi:hypothetical protein